MESKCACGPAATPEVRFDGYGLDHLGRRRENHPLQEKLVRALWDAIDACNGLADLYHEHADGCEESYCRLCDFCQDAEGMGFSFRLYRDILECQVFPFGQWDEALEQRGREMHEADQPVIATSQPPARNERRDQ